MNTVKFAGFDQATDSIPYSPDGIGTLIAIDRLFRDKRKVVTLHPGKKGWVNRISNGPEGTTIETYEPEVSAGKKKKTKVIEVEVDDDE
jgi:hypothetical protein